MPPRSRPQRHTRTERRGPADPSRTAAREHAHLAGGHPRGALEEVGTPRRDPLCVLALACSHTLSRRWRARDRQERRQRVLRVAALGRQNLLFAGSDQGGKRAAAIIRCQAPSSPTVSTRRSTSSTHRRHPISRIDELLPLECVAYRTGVTHPYLSGYIDTRTLKLLTS